MLEVISKKYFYSKVDLNKTLDEFDGFRLYDPMESRKKSELISTELTNSFVWRHTNEWSQEWEKKYAEWINENVDTNFYLKYNIKTDCADAAYGLKWIFARIHSLPVANRVEATGRFISNYSMKRAWRNLSTSNVWHEDKRFLAALNHMMNTTSTRTISADSYPLAVNNEAIRPGVIFLLSIHARIAYRSPALNVTTPLSFLNSTVPRRVRSLSSGVFNDRKPTEGFGFRQFRWPIITNENKWALKTKEDMVHYSMEQYENDFEDRGSSFSLTVHHKLFGDLEEVIRSSFDGLITTLKDSIHERKRVVLDGFDICQRDACDPTSTNYDNWSTFSRDKRLVREIKTLFADKENLSKYNKNLVESIWKEKAEKIFIDIEDHKIRFPEFLKLISHYNFSSDPRVSVEERWGVSNLVEHRKKLIERVSGNVIRNFSSEVDKYLDLKYKVEKRGNIKFSSMKDNNEICKNTRLKIFKMNGRLVKEDFGSCTVLIKKLKAKNYIFRIQGYSDNSKINVKFKIEKE